MRFTTSALALALVTIALADGDAPSDVLNLVATDFDAKVNPESLMLVEFFAPWSELFISKRAAYHVFSGVDTAKPLRLIMKRLLLLSKKRTSSSPKSTV